MESNFISYDQIPPYQEVDPFLLFRNVSNKVFNSQTIPEMIEAVNSLRQMRKYKKDAFLITFSNCSEEFLKKFLNIEDTLGKDQVIYNSMMFLKEIYLIPDFSELEKFTDEIFDAIEPFFNFQQNIQIQNLARDILASSLGQCANTTSIYTALSDFLEAGDQARYDFWIDKIKIFLTIFDPFNYVYFFDFPKIIQDLQEKISNEHYVQNNLDILLKFFAQLKITIGLEEWNNLISTIDPQHRAFLNNLC